MPRKKSVRAAVERFHWYTRSITDYLDYFAKRQSGYINAIYSYAIVWLYSEFELLMLQSLIGALNHDSTHFSSRTGVQWPKHLSDRACRYLIMGEAFFDFRGRAGLIDTCKRVVPDGHYLLTVVKDPKYRDALDKLVIFRNYAAHSSDFAKDRAKKLLGVKRIPYAGTWLSKQGRFQQIMAQLSDLATALKAASPY